MDHPIYIMKNYFDCSLYNYLKVKDADNVNHNVIGTHFLDLSTLSNEGEKGE